MGSFDTSFMPITIEEYKRRIASNPISKVSVYITPGGDIIDTRAIVGSHTDFTDMAYRNLSMISDIQDEFGNVIYNSVLGDRDLEGMSKVEACSFVRKMLMAGLPLDESNPEHKKLIESRMLYVADDDLLVHDMGFVKLGLMPKLGSMAICVPSKAINGHGPTGPQRAAVFDVAECHFFEYDDISDSYRSACRKSEEITNAVQSVIDDDDIM